MLPTSKTFFLLLIISSTAFSMDCTTAPIGSGQARTFANDIDSRLKHELNQTLIPLTDEHNPTVLLDKFIAHYQSQRSQTRFIDYVTRFRINITKIMRYRNLASKISGEIYGPIIMAGIENNTIEEAEQDLIQMEADELKKEVMAREWALESIQCDLEEQLAKLKNIHKWKDDAAARLPLVEQQDEAFEMVTERINAHETAIERAISAIAQRQKIYKINRNTVDFMIQKATKGTLQKTLDELAPVYSLKKINDLFKASNPNKNSILHAVCDDQTLPANKFRVVVEFFARAGQNINEVNGNGESVLSYAQNKQLDAEYLKIIQEHGGLPLKNLKSAFKKAAAAHTQAKKTLRISDDSPEKKEREEQRALTQSMGLL